VDRAGHRGPDSAGHEARRHPSEEAVTLAGDSVTHSVDWDLGLDAWPFQSNGLRVANAEITITPR